MFREAALEHVTILKQIDSILKRKSDHSIADEFFHDILDEHFSEDEVQRQLDTAMNWGRYAEIFDYDRESGRLTQAEAAQSEIVRPHRGEPGPSSHAKSLIGIAVEERKPSHEEKHQPAGILGLPFVVAIAEPRNFAPARCHHVRGGDCAVLCRGDGRSRVVGPFTPSVEISRSLRALPAYAGYSLLRITIAYILSLGFTLVYGYVAAYNQRAERFMIPLLDVLQSIPVLSFLPGVMLAMVALFPGRQLGVELGAILLILLARYGTWPSASMRRLKSIPKGNARGGDDLPLQLVAALHADGVAIFRDRIGLELDDVGGWRMVRADGLRNVRAGDSETFVCPAWVPICKPQPAPET